MPTYATKSRSVVELDVFTGSPNSAAELGLYEARYTERGADRPAWNTVEEVGPYWTLDGRTEVLPGTVFERQAIETDGDLILGAWSIVGPVLSMGDAYEAVNLNRNRVNSPGSPMRNPTGLILRDANGDTILRPAIGEQDRDPLTGELMVDALNAPVLVPA
tara:strand:+ start:255 stop:737 length:483 start_codon:yes stop_codon:yes gene_type:complete